MSPSHRMVQHVPHGPHCRYPGFITWGLSNGPHLCGRWVGNSRESLCSLEKHSANDWWNWMIAELPHPSAKLSPRYNLQSSRVPHQDWTSVVQRGKLIDNVYFSDLCPFPASCPNPFPAPLGITSGINCFDSDSTYGELQHKMIYEVIWFQ